MRCVIAFARFVRFVDLSVSPGGNQPAMNISGILALVGVLLIVLGFLGLASVVGVPGVPLIVLGVVCLVLAAFVGGGLRGRAVR